MWVAQLKINSYNPQFILTTAQSTEPLCYPGKRKHHKVPASNYICKIWSRLPSYGFSIQTVYCVEEFFND
jgi:hypothetical protein